MNGADDAEFVELFRRARQGDGAALGRLLERYRGYLTLLAGVQIGRRLQGKVDPADLVQETFLEAHRNLPLFRGAVEAEFACWLRQILAGRLANVVRRFLGTRARDVRLEQDLAQQLDASSQALSQALAASQSSPSQQAARSEQSLRLADALAGLPANYREVIVLRHLEGLPFAEVARRMGRNVDSVEKLWIRALGRLRGVLGEVP
jgi:RNA polymerase sigma-70 factor, ECF subfamily